MLDLVFNERPTLNNNNTRVLMITFSCKETPFLSENQVRLTTNYSGSECDTLSKKFSYNPNSLLISVSSSLNTIICGYNNKKSGIPKSALLGIILGSIFGVSLIILIASLVHWNREKLFDRKVKKLDTQFKSF